MRDERNRKAKETEKRCLTPCIIHLYSKVIPTILIWIFLVEIPIGVYILKDGGLYILDDNYYLAGWPGSIFDRLIGHEVRLKIQGDVTQFAISPEFIVVYTDQGWNAINRNTHSITANYNSLDNLSLDLNLPELEVYINRPWLLLRFFWHIPVYIAVGIILTILFWKLTFAIL